MMNNQNMLISTKILVINARPMSDATAESITVNSFFSLLPRENVLELDLSPIQYTDNQKKHTMLFIPRHQSIIKKISKIGLLQRANFQIKKNEACNTDKKNQFSHQGLISKIRQWAAIHVSNPSYFFTKKILNEIESFQPNLIYTTAGSLSVMKIVNKLSEKMNIPVVPHFMDNWQEALEWGENSFLRRYKRKIDKEVARMYKNSKCCICISDEMADVYEKKWKIPHLSLMNVADMNEFLCSDKKLNDKIRVVYAGGLHLDRWIALKEMSDAFQQVSKECNKECQMHIYTSEKDQVFSQFFDSNEVVFHKPISHTCVKKIFEEADVLVHAETNRLLSDKYAVYSLSTKLPEYLASNRNFIYYGPEHLYLTRFLQKESACFVCCNQTDLYQTIKSVFFDYDKSAKFISKAKTTASIYFSKEHAEKILEKAFAFSREFR